MPLVSRRMNDSRWLRAQVISGAVFAVFLFGHLLNQMLAVLGAGTYDGTQQTMRRVYQAPGLELALVFIPLVVHLTTTIVRMVKRPKQDVSTLSWRVRLHRYSGRFLLLVIGGHVVATRGASLLYGVFPGFHGLAFTFQWVPAYFWPYYLLLALCGWYHLAHGLSMAAAVLKLPGADVLQHPLVFRTLVASGAFALIAGVLGLGGVLTDVGHPSTSEYARLVLRLSE